MSLPTRVEYRLVNLHSTALEIPLGTGLRSHLASITEIEIVDITGINSV